MRSQNWAHAASLLTQDMCPIHNNNPVILCKVVADFSALALAQQAFPWQWFSGRASNDGICNKNTVEYNETQ